MHTRFDLVEVTRDGPVAVVAMNRPDKRNAMNLQLLQELTLALADVQHASDIRAVVLTGRGDVFCAGADRSPVAGLAGDELARAFGSIAVDVAHGVAQLMLRLVSMPKPVVGAINGPAVGGGLILALGCDLRYIADDASCWMPELGMGRAIGAPSMATFVACVGPLAAKDIVFTSRRLSATEMAALHLVNGIVRRDEVLGTALASARTLATRDADAVGTAKARANAGLMEIWQKAAASVDASR